MLHLPSRLIGEGDGQNVIWRRSALDEVRHTESDDTCFARAGTGQNHDRAFQSGDCIALLRVEGIDVYHKINGHRIDCFSRKGSSEKRFRLGLLFVSGVDESGLRSGSAGGKDSLRIR